MSRHSRRRLTSFGALVLAGSLAMSACGGDSEDADDATPAADAPTLSPLTGLPIKGEGPEHPVLAVKIDNSGSSAPQIGLGSADMVVEELVEGGITRLASFFYTQVPDNVGPVRSMRATDIGIVQPLDAVLVASGGARPTVQRIKGADIKTFTEGAKGYYRATGRQAPYNLFMRLTDLAGTLRAKSAPEPYLPFGEAADFPKGKPAGGLTASFSPSSSSAFEFRNGRYLNTDSLAADGDEFVADTVLVLRVRVGDAGYTDPAGYSVPETKFTGRGAAMVFHDGRVVEGTWVKDGLDATVQLTAGGKELTIPPGQVWIELVPAKGGQVTVSR